MLSFQDVTLRRNGEVLLEHLSLTLYQGQKVGLVGANGIGKTSLFKLILGELEADQGDVELNRQVRIAHMAQEVSGTDETALSYVLSGDIELTQIQAKIADAERDQNFEPLGALFEALTDHDGFTAEARAEQLLVGLGFKTEDFQQPISAFSGGWRVRLNLARTLMQPSDLLLLDEPTNHLDLDAIFWLVNWIARYSGTLILISHDREFLDECVQHIAFMAKQRIQFYAGNYSAFELLRADQLRDQAKQYEKQQKNIAHMESFIRRFRYKESKARQAQSRIKALERLTRVEAVHQASPFQFSIREADRQSDPLIALQDAELGYDAAVLTHVNLSLAPGDRLGLLGINGAGKSTLIKSIQGTLPLIKGERTPGLHLKIGYFSQHQVDDLDLQLSPMNHLQRLAPTVSELELRTYLGGFQFQGDQVEQPARQMSGGEKARLALAIVSFQQPNLLLLDEPTNHLDMQMRQALATAMNTFAGAILLISHDQYLLTSTVDAFLLVQGGQVSAFKGSLEDYRAQLDLINEAKPTHDVNGPIATQVTRSTEPKPKDRGQGHKRLRQLTTRVHTIENRISQLAEQLKVIEADLAQPSLYEHAQSEALDVLLKDQSAVKEAIAQLEEEWFGLENERDQLT